MKTYRPLKSIVLTMFIGGCSDAAQFSNASAPNVINAERIINPEGSMVDPSADATAPGVSTNPSVAGTTEDGTTTVGGDGTSTGSSGGGTGGSKAGGGAGAAGGSGGTGGSGTGSGSTGGNTSVAGSGSGSTSSNSPAAVATAVDKLKAACMSGVKKTMKQSIHFPEVQHCTWSANGNLGRLDAHVQAIEGQKATIELPLNAQLCELGIGSVATTIQYDDFMLLTLNNQVLLSSNKDLLQGLQADQAQSFAWDFSKVRGKAINFDAAPYCLGDASLCKVPVTDVQGSFQFSIDPSSLGKVAAASPNKKNLEFALFATGDNDDRDCWHTAFTLDFTLNYVE
ncbi:MAG: hypothetical protein H7318_12430 [Oligoflexus sp.]|nr:hypothetical protein [Oligoflexus sp.]